MERKENDRLHEKMRTLRAEEDEINPINTYRIRYGKLYKNENVVDEFNLSNQLFC